MWRQAVTGTNLAVVMGGLGLLALATPAAYIAYQSRTSGESAASLTKVIDIMWRQFVMMASSEILQEPGVRHGPGG